MLMMFLYFVSILAILLSIQAMPQPLFDVAKERVNLQTPSSTFQNVVKATANTEKDIRQVTVSTTALVQVSLKHKQQAEYVLSCRTDKDCYNNPSGPSVCNSSLRQCNSIDCSAVLNYCIKAPYKKVMKEQKVANQCLYCLLYGESTSTPMAAPNVPEQNTQEKTNHWKAPKGFGLSWGLGFGAALLSIAALVAAGTIKKWKQHPSTSRPRHSLPDRNEDSGNYSKNFDPERAKHVSVGADKPPQTPSMQCAQNLPSGSDSSTRPPSFPSLNFESAPSISLELDSSDRSSEKAEYSSQILNPTNSLPQQDNLPASTTGKSHPSSKVGSTTEGASHPHRAASIQIEERGVALAATPVADPTNDTSKSLEPLEQFSSTDTSLSSDRSHWRYPDGYPRCDSNYSSTDGSSSVSTSLMGVCWSKELQDVLFSTSYVRHLSLGNNDQLLIFVDEAKLEEAKLELVDLVRQYWQREWEVLSYPKANT